MKSKRLYYVINARVPSENAHGLQVSKMCEAFAQLGQEVVLVLPKRFNATKKSIQDYYSLKTSFEVRKLPVIDLMPIGFPLAFLIEAISFSVSAFFYFLFKPKLTIYCRGEIAPYLLFASRLRGHKLFWETHIKPVKWGIYKSVLKKADGVVVITRYYQTELLESGLISAERLIYAPDGVDLEKFDLPINKEDVRKRLGLPVDKKIVMYVGSDLDWKGLSLLKGAVKYFSDEFQVFFVGKITKDKSVGDKPPHHASHVDGLEIKSGETGRVLCGDEYTKLQARCGGKGVFVGYKPNSEIPIWLKSADVLVMTGDASSRISKFYTSPIKLFEYLASKRPIVAVDLPSFRDILNEENALLINTNDPETFASAIMDLCRNEKLMQSLSDKAFTEAKSFDWQNRASGIIKFIDSKIS